jgi:hypothetical protein
MQPDELLQRWKGIVPRDGVDCDDVAAVIRHLGMEVIRRPSGHWIARHPALIGSASFPQGVITINCHAFGKQGRAHPAAVRDIVRAATIIEENHR